MILTNAKSCENQYRILKFHLHQIFGTDFES